MRWGVGSTALSVEGGGASRPRSHARAPETVWTGFCQWPGRIADGSTPASSTDHLSVLEDDVGLFARTGVDLVAFTVSWARVFPEGRGRMDPAGLDVYDRMTDRICDAGLAPMACLHHWDLPATLQNIEGPHGGGWLNRDTIPRFRDYACTVAERLADRLDTVMVMNDPARLALEGYGEGRFPPGEQAPSSVYGALHHQTLAAADTLKAMRGEAPKTRIGVIAGSIVFEPAGDSQADADARDIVSSLVNEASVSALANGRYPEMLTDGFSEWEQDGDAGRLSADFDTLGIDVTGISKVRHAGGRVLTPRASLPALPFAPEQAADTARQALEQILALAPDSQDICAFIRPGPSRNDALTPSGVLDDDRADRLAALISVAAETARVSSIIIRPFLDGFEPVTGLSERQGLVHVDFRSGVRTPKRSWSLLARHLGAA